MWRNPIRWSCWRPRWADPRARPTRGGQSQQLLMKPLIMDARLLTSVRGCATLRRNMRSALAHSHAVKRAAFRALAPTRGYLSKHGAATQREGVAQAPDTGVRLLCRPD